MRICSPDAYKEKKNPLQGIYGVAIIVGIIFFALGLVITKGMIWFTKLIFSNWAYIVAGIVILIFLRKVLGRKHMVVHQAETNHPGY